MILLCNIVAQVSVFVCIFKTNFEQCKQLGDFCNVKACWRK